MNKLFFGKISQKYDTKQLEEGYYEAPKGSTWFGNLKISDYVYIIGNDKVQFWQAKDWKTVAGKERLYFTRLNTNIGISITDFLSIHLFKISKALAVLTSRSARNKAFFEITLTEPIDLKLLADTGFYQNRSLFRQINLVKDSESVDPVSKDIQLFLDEKESLGLYPSPFIEPEVLSLFRDNFGNIGKGAKMKDKTLSILRNGLQNAPVKIPLNQISLRSLYDVLFCDYKVVSNHYLLGAYWNDADPMDRTQHFIKEGIWYNGFEDQLLKEVKAIAVGSKVAIKSAYVVGNKSVIKVKTIGVVTGNPGDGRTLEVEWEEDFEPVELQIGNYRKTYHEVSNEKHIKMIWGEEDDTPTTAPGAEKIELMNVQIPLNQILYGPPGTGKTYHTINKALAIIEGTTEAELAKRSRQELKKIYEERVEQGQIMFTTFHQSMGYEDFVEGIKPDITEDEKGNKGVIYETRDGVFKQLVKKALQNVSPKAEIEREISFEDAWNDLVQRFEERKEELKLKTLSGKNMVVTELTANGNLNVIPELKGKKDYLVSFERLKRLQEAFPDLTKVKNIDKEFRSVIGGMNSTAYWAVLDEINQWLKKHRANVVVGINPIKRYVLIIDEINRGNISAIFGELITLIEESKRKPICDADLEKCHDTIEVTLPFSKDKFCVPSNLYIIGTMNTADRSVEALDTALRRRFTFEEMMPKPVLLNTNRLIYEALWKYEKVDWGEQKWVTVEKGLNELYSFNEKWHNSKEELWASFQKIGKEVGDREKLSEYHENLLNLENILTIINRRIEVLLDRDHRIGHSYFIDVKSLSDLKAVFYDKVIPLLQEYFYGDYGKIGLVLGSGFIEKETVNADVFADFEPELADNFDEKPIYYIKDYRNFNNSQTNDMLFKQAVLVLLKQA